LGALGLRLGRESVFLLALLNSGPARLGALLGAVHRQRPLPELPAPGALCFEPGPELDETLCRALGYRRLEHGTAIALRADALERLAHEAYRLSEQGFFAPTPKLERQTGCGAAQLETALAAIGYRVRRNDTGVSFGRARPGRAPKRGARRGVKNGKGPGAAPSADSPFAKLRDFEPGK
jgi:ATP-dependent RNA helicase SUPV3L1/SUV3